MTFVMVFWGLNRFIEYLETMSQSLQATNRKVCTPKKMGQSQTVLSYVIKILIF